MRSIYLPENRTLTRGKGAALLAETALALFVVLSNSAALTVGASASDTGSTPDASCIAGQCFADVPPGNPFVEFANRIYLQGLVTGYPCGGPGEPCDAENRPYYRAGAGVTRQQMAKFIDNARRLPSIQIDSSVGTEPVWVRNQSSGAIYGETNTGSAITGYSSEAYGQGMRGTGHFGVLGVSSPAIPIPFEQSMPEGGPANPIGVAGFSNSEPNGMGVYGYGNTWGLYGVTPSGGATGAGAGVYGESTGESGIGVLGRANTNAPGSYASGVVGISTDGSGVTGLAAGTHDAIIGVNTGSGSGLRGLTNSALGYGLVAENTGGGSAAYFSGDVQVTGNLSKGGGSFKIDHPLDPENKYLYHSFVESPDMMNIYNGNVTTDANGEVTVTMPEWFDALNRDFRYQLTAIGQFAQVIVAREMEENTFVIKSDKPNMKVSWQVTGIRHDPYANEHRIPVEEDKVPDDRGKYLYPTEQGQPESRGIEYDMLREMEEMVPPLN